MEQTTLFTNLLQLHKQLFSVICLYSTYNKLVLKVAKAYQLTKYKLRRLGDLGRASHTATAYSVQRVPVRNLQIYIACLVTQQASLSTFLNKLYQQYQLYLRRNKQLLCQYRRKYRILLKSVEDYQQRTQKVEEKIIRYKYSATKLSANDRSQKLRLKMKLQRYKRKQAQLTHLQQTTQLQLNQEVIDQVMSLDCLQREMSQQVCQMSEQVQRGFAGFHTQMLAHGGLLEHRNVDATARVSEPLQQT